MSQPTLRVIGSVAGPGQGRTRSVALIGDYPPRRCGIATFTADVRRALRGARAEASCDVYALSDNEDAYRYPAEVVCEIRQENIGDYLEAADRLNAARPDLICVQHEFGIFGGAAGENLLSLLEATDIPVVTTLHTILARPTADQRRVFSRLIARSARLIVMAERGRDILRREWRVAPEKIVLIPHGAPDRALLPSDPFKEALGYGGRDLLFTFGLLSPGKGVETVIEALPRIVRDHPSVLYVVLGATHPHLIAKEGERYRESLSSLARELGVEAHVELLDTYTDEERLVEHLQAADIYITPYLNPEQITSGTLAYAAALGRPIISTPYLHAEELLAEGRGRLTPFGSSSAMANEVLDLLAHPEAREAMGALLYEAARETVWRRFGARMFEVFDLVCNQSALAGSPTKQPGLSRRTIEASLGGLRRLTDDCGLLQHSVFSVPDRRHGYCVDDNARALLLMNRLGAEAPGAESRALTSVYAAFVAHAWNDEERRFRNFMSFERKWLEAAGSEDSTGRAVWAAAATAALALDPGHRRWAAGLIDRFFEREDGITSPRANAFIILGLCTMIGKGMGGERLREVLSAKADHLVAMLRPGVDRRGFWFEDYLSYDNARLAEAVIRAGAILAAPAMATAGVDALKWLCRRQTGDSGNFLPVATADFGRGLQSKTLFDQQPVEVAATVDACEAAFSVTRDFQWIEEAGRAYAWLLGANTVGASLLTGDGECFDGLTWAGVNENQGCESVLAAQSAASTMRMLALADSSRAKSAGDI